MLEISGVSRSCEGPSGVRDVTFSLQPGEILGLLGPNDAEKQTMLRLLAGHVVPTSGTIRINGTDLRDRRDRIGYLSAKPPAFRGMTVQEYVTLAAALRGVPAGERYERIHKVLASVQLASVASEKVGSLSPACWQRVGLAQAVVHDPEVLVLDDPVRGLYTPEVVALSDVIRHLAQGRPVVISAEREADIRLLCDRAVVMEDGQVVDLPMDRESEARAKRRRSTRKESILQHMVAD